MLEALQKHCDNLNITYKGVLHNVIYWGFRVPDSWVDILETHMGENTSHISRNRMKLLLKS